MICRSVWFPLVVQSVVVAGAIGGGIAVGRWWSRSHESPPPAVADHPPDAPKRPANRVRLDAARRRQANVRIEPIAMSEASDSIVVTGKLALDEDRLAHIYSPVEGVLREAPVKLGESVAAGRALAMVDSKEIGDAKLDLVRQRMNVGFARTNKQWAETIHANTQALIAELAKSPPVTELETRFRDQPMGDNRQLLVTAYAKHEQTKADFERLRTLRDQSVGVEKDYIRAKADYESASATFQAAVEQLKFTTKQRLLETEQRLQEALTTEQVSRALLLILGYSEADIAKMDPIGEGEAVAHYPIRAPFAGTVIGKHAVLSEHVGPQHQLYEIADLSRVWLHADVFEKDLVTLGRVAGETLRFRAAGYPDREFTAQIFHTGDAVDDRTRAVKLIAVAENAEGLLKPGMFVEASLPLGTTRKSLRIPAGAVQRQDDETYVFVALDAEEFERRPIRAGRAAAATVEVLEGLQPGESVVVEGALALKSEMLKELLSE